MDILHLKLANKNKLYKISLNIFFKLQNIWSWTLTDDDEGRDEMSE